MKYQAATDQGGMLFVKTRTKILLYLLLFAVIDTVIPVPITAIVLISVLFNKPEWFKNLVSEIYST